MTSAADPHCRIGQIRAKNGAVVRVLPGLAERDAKKALAALDAKMARVNEIYARDLDGFILIAWNADGLWSCYRRPGRLQHGNSLADFARGAVQRQLAMEDAQELLEDILCNK